MRLLYEIDPKKIAKEIGANSKKSIKPWKIKELIDEGRLDVNKYFGISDLIKYIVKRRRKYINVFERVFPRWYEDKYNLLQWAIIVGASQPHIFAILEDTHPNSQTPLYRNSALHLLMIFYTNESVDNTLLGDKDIRWDVTNMYGDQPVDLLFNHHVLPTVTANIRPELWRLIPNEALLRRSQDGKTYKEIIEELISSGDIKPPSLEGLLDRPELPRDLVISMFDEILTPTLKKILNQQNVNLTDDLGRSLLAITSSINKVKILVEKGADIDLPDKFGRTPLYWQILNNNTEIAKYLLKVGADPLKGNPCAYELSYEINRPMFNHIRKLIEPKENEKISLDRIVITPKGERLIIRNYLKESDHTESYYYEDIDYKEELRDLIRVWGLTYLERKGFIEIDL